MRGGDHAVQGDHVTKHRIDKSYPFTWRVSQSVDLFWTFKYFPVRSPNVSETHASLSCLMISGRGVTRLMYYA